MSLSAQWLDELRARTTLSALIGRTVKIQRAGREYKACCPFHHEKTPSFTINDEKGFYHCFGCSAHGDAIRWMTDQRGLSFMDAVKELADAAGMTVPAPDPRAARQAERAKSLRDVTEAAARWFQDQLGGIEGAAARAYLDRRGIDEATRRAFGLGFAPDSRNRLKAALKEFPAPMPVEAGMLIQPDSGEPYDRFRGRLMIPIRDARGQVIAFGGRILGDGEPKYLNSPDTPLFDKGRTLYNIDRASPAARRTNRVIVVEGYLDVIALAQAGFDDAVAPLGTALTEHQIALLWRLSPAPVLCFDGDAAGQKAALRAALRALPELRPDYSLRFAALPLNQDPDDVVRAQGADGFARIVDHARDLASFLWGAHLALADTSTPSGRAGLRARMDAISDTIRDNASAQEYRRYFRSQFYDSFGWKRGDVRDLRRSIEQDRPAQRPSGAEALIRAVLMGLMRHTQVLHEQIEAVSALDIASDYYRRWRDRLVDAALNNAGCEEDVIDDILSQTDLAPIDRRDYARDLGFSFYHTAETHPQAARDLVAVLDTLGHEQALRESAQRALDRFNRSQDEGDWRRYAQLRQEVDALTRRHADLLTQAQDAA